VTPGRPRSFDRDEALKQATLVFWKHGYDATSVALLTEAMGIGAPSMYAAFGDKRALFEEALEHYMQNYGSFMARLFVAAPNVRVAIEQLLRDAAAMFTSADHPRGCMLITAATNCTPESATVAKRLQAIRARTVEALEARIGEAMEAGELPASADARALALFFVATLQGMSWLARDGASRADLEAILQTAMRAWPQVSVAATKRRADR
jgi:TetR/AcrR family transcriptional regulator, copper-responsive repressor